MLKIYTTPKMGKLEYSEEEENNYVRKLHESQTKKIKLTESECKAYPLDSLERMERSGNYEFPKSYLEKIRLLRNAYDYHVDEEDTLDQSEALKASVQSRVRLTMKESDQDK